MTKQELIKYIADMQKQGTGKYTKTATFKPGPSALGENGTVSGFFARYDRIKDSYGDVCKRGFVDESVRKRAATGKPFPLCYNHDFNQIIGAVISIEDKPEGAFFTAKFFDTPRAQEVRELVKSGVLYQMSFAYDVQESGKVTLPDGSRANELRKCELFEVSIVTVPAQPLSVITEIKGGRDGARSKADQEKNRRDLLRYLEGMEKARERHKK